MCWPWRRSGQRARWKPASAGSGWRASAGFRWPARWSETSGSTGAPRSRFFPETCPPIQGSFSQARALHTHPTCGSSASSRRSLDRQERGQRLGPTCGSIVRSSFCLEIICHELSAMSSSSRPRPPKVFEGDDPALEMVEIEPSYEREAAALEASGEEAQEPGPRDWWSAGAMRWSAILFSALAGLAVLSAGSWLAAFASQAVLRDDWVG